FHPARHQVAHYYRFQQLRSGRCYRRGDTPLSGPTGDAIRIDLDGVYPMRPNPHTGDHAPGSAIFLAQNEFNKSYSDLLRLLDRSFNGSPDLLDEAIGSMFTLRSQAQKLMQMPSGDGRSTAGPTFEYVPADADPMGDPGAAHELVTTQLKTSLTEPSLLVT
ncbi:MAG TPA: hypothetical protein VHZ96_02290, partial [Frankiaceae bacterium]|nr:hypothetical protein [Frankiaceae bacterium]